MAWCQVSTSPSSGKKYSWCGRAIVKPERIILNLPKCYFPVKGPPNQELLQCTHAVSVSTRSCEDLAISCCSSAYLSPRSDWFCPDYHSTNRFPWVSQLAWMRTIIFIPNRPYGHRVNGSRTMKVWRILNFIFEDKLFIVDEEQNLTHFVCSRLFFIKSWIVYLGFSIFKMAPIIQAGGLVPTWHRLLVKIIFKFYTCRKPHHYMYPSDSPS